MKFSTSPVQVIVQLSISELSAIRQIIGPTSLASRVRDGMSERSSKMLSVIYDEISDFFDGQKDEK